MAERVYVDYGPHFQPDGKLWELHLQMGPRGSPRYKFQSAWEDEAGARKGAAELAGRFGDDSTFIAVDFTRRVVAVKFITD